MMLTKSGDGDDDNDDLQEILCENEDKKSDCSLASSGFLHVIKFSTFFSSS